MSAIVEDSDVAVDLSKLIGLEITFAPLQLTLQRILQRLSALEAENASKNEEIAALQAAVNELREQQQQQNGASDNTEKEAGGCNGTEEHEAMWMEIDRLGGILGELQNQEKERHTIDELYAARKRRDSCVSRVSLSPGSPQKLPRGSADAARPPSQTSPTAEIAAAAGEATAAAGADHESDGAEDGPFTAYEAELPTVPGDRVLTKAHEQLPGLDATLRYEAGGEEGGEAGGWPSRSGSASAGAGGDSMQPHAQPAVGKPPLSRPTSSSSAQGTREESAAPPASHEAARRASHVPSARRSTVGGLPTPSRRQSQQTAATPSGTVADRLRQDGADIAYLNRVVAEILGEMKVLHDDVGQLQATGAVDTDAGDTSGAAADQLAGRVHELEKHVADLQDTVRRQQEDGARVRGDLDELTVRLRPAAQLTDDDVDGVKRLPALQDRVQELENAVKANALSCQRIEEKLESLASLSGDAVDGISAAQFALLQGAVSALEKELAELQRSRSAENSGSKEHADDIARLREALQRLQEELAGVKVTVDGSARECARLEDVKANRNDVLGALSDLRELVGSSGGAGAGGEAADARLRDVEAALARVEAEISRLQSDKADSAALQRLRDDLSALKRLMELNAQRDSAAALAAAGKDANAGAAAASEGLLQELQRQLLAQAENSNRDRAMAGEDVDELRQLIDQLDRRKADSTLVANKAERDYVENALERLMREVEQVLNATNAGLIDTLDKSLNILRDMLDGKANKYDIQRLQQQMAAEGTSGAAADGLTGVKGYRCLGCNRPMETLRPRTMASSATPFLNRNPQNYPKDAVTRTIQQQQTAYDRSEHAKQLPPIEGPRQ